MADINHSTNNKVLNLIIIYHYFFFRYFSFHCGNHPEIIYLYRSLVLLFSKPWSLHTFFFHEVSILYVPVPIYIYTYCVYEWHQHFYFYLVLFFIKLYTKWHHSIYEYSYNRAHWSVKFVYSIYISKYIYIYIQ